MKTTPRLYATLIALLLATTTPAAAQTKRPRITGVAHIALYSADIAKTRAYYRDILGFHEPYSLNNPDGSFSMTFFKVNERQYIEIFPETKPHTDRLAHISVETDDIEGMRLYLAEKGIPVPAKVNTGRIKNKSFNVKDPDGHIVEFVQYMPDGWTVREKGKHLPNGVSARMMHIGIIVNSLEPAMRFYRDILGFEEFWRGARDPKVLQWVNMRVPDGNDYIEFMLHHPVPEETKRGSAHHICLEVPNMEKALQAIEALPARKSYTLPLEIRTGINRKRQLNLFDPDGTRTELMEPNTVDGKPAPSSTLPPPR
ncbi:MAG: VOC family protein [Bryobacterales bacterium]|nr:VOC family protein [Bryobacterales bacterium]